MNNNNCFEKLNLKLSTNHSIFNEHLTFDYGHVDVRLYSENNTFLRYSLPDDYFKGEAIYEVMQQYKLKAKIFLMEPGYLYNWHRDAWRNIAFNMLLTDDPNYILAFAHTYRPAQIIDPNKFMYSPFTSLRYEPNTLYLLNSQIPHLVFNYGTVNRYLLTIAHYESQPVPSYFQKPADQTSYVATVTDLNSKGLIANASSNPNN